MFLRGNNSSRRELDLLLFLRGNILLLLRGNISCRREFDFLLLRGNISCRREFDFLLLLFSRGKVDS
jgi:hypothetical protein